MKIVSLCTICWQSKFYGDVVYIVVNPRLLPGQFYSLYRWFSENKNTCILWTFWVIRLLSNLDPFFSKYPSIYTPVSYNRGYLEKKRSSFWVPLQRSYRCLTQQVPQPCFSPVLASKTYAGLHSRANWDPSYITSLMFIETALFEAWILEFNQPQVRWFPK